MHSEEIKEKKVKYKKNNTYLGGILNVILLEEERHCLSLAFAL